MRSITNGDMGICLLAVALATSACDAGDKKETAAASAAPSATAKADANALAVGKVVVATSAPNSFTEGTVASIEGDKVTYEYGEPDKTTNKRATYAVDKAKAFLLGDGLKAPAKVGELLIATNATGSWVGCEVKTAAGGVYGCEDWYGTVNNVEGKSAVKPDAATSADIKDSLAKAAKHRAFAKEAQAAGKPVKPTGWKPKAKDAVVVAFAGASWYGGTVEKVDGAKVTIKWDSTAWKDPADKAENEVAPLPKAAQKAEAGQFVIVPPRSAGFEWEYRKVVSVTKDSAEVVDRDGNKSTVSLKDVLPIAP